MRNHLFFFIMSLMKNQDVNALLSDLALKYETTDFLEADPSRFLRYYKRTTDAEVFSFVAAMLSFGNRKQFIPKIQLLADLAGESFAAWIMSGNYRKDLLSPDGNQETKFYRFYSYKDMYVFFDELQQILRISGSFGRFFRESWQDLQPVEWREGGKSLTLSDCEKYQFSLDRLISQSFPSSDIVSKGKNSANKRIHMFLRWMVRRNSPVDLGLWTWYDPSLLIMPLDVHVMEESMNLGLLPENAKADRKTAVKLTERMKEIWPLDPVKGDFALFGLGVD